MDLIMTPEGTYWQYLDVLIPVSIKTIPDVSGGNTVELMIDRNNKYDYFETELMPNEVMTLDQYYARYTEIRADGRRYWRTYSIDHPGTCNAIEHSTKQIY